MKILACFICVLICLGVGMAASWATLPEITHWYPTLHQPVFTPPAYVFGPAWTILYVLMGVNAGLVLTTPSPYRLKALIWFIIQLIFNGLWSFIFFTWHHLSLALLDLGLLWVALVLAAYYSYKVKACYIGLLAPYLAWVSFAFVINACVVYIN